MKLLTYTNPAAEYQLIHVRAVSSDRLKHGATYEVPDDLAPRLLDRPEWSEAGQETPSDEGDDESADEPTADTSTATEADSEPTKRRSRRSKKTED